MVCGRRWVQGEGGDGKGPKVRKRWLCGGPVHWFMKLEGKRKWQQMVMEEQMELVGHGRFHLIPRMLEYH